MLSNSPGTILHELRCTPPDRPAREMQRERAFQDSVYAIRDVLDRLEEGKD